MTKLENIENKWLLRYEEYLMIEKGRSLGTIKNYIQKIKNFFNWLKANHLTLNEDSIYLYRKYLLQKNLSLKTTSYYLIALRNFFRFLKKKKVPIIDPELIELPKLPERDIEVLSEKELLKLLSAPSSNSLKALRDKAILETLFSTGLRVSELCSLNRNINLNQEEIKVYGKGGKVRVVFLSERAKTALQKYLEKRNDSEKALFVNLSKNKKFSRLTPRAVELIIKKYAKKVGILHKVTPHTLRHQFATDLLKAGADLRAIQILLGHKNIQTTQIYTHITDKMLKEIHKTYHGKSVKFKNENI